MSLHRPRRVPRIRLLAGGHLVIATTVLLGVAAVHTGLNLLHALVAALLAFQAVSGFRSFLVLRGLEVEVDVPPSVDAGGEAALALALTNRKRRVPSVSLEVEATCEGRGRVEVAPVWIARVEPAGRVAVRLPVTGVTRGPARLVALRISTSYPCDLFKRTLVVPIDEEVLVRPRRVDAPVPDVGGRDGAVRRRAPAGARGSGDLRRLRPYRPGDSPRSIHWKTSARRGTLHVREDETLRPADLAVVLDPPRDLPAEEVDAAVERAAALCRAARRDERVAWLCLAGAPARHAVRDPRSLSAALDALARFEPGGPLPPAPPPGAVRVVVGRAEATPARTPAAAGTSR